MSFNSDNAQGLVTTTDATLTTVVTYDFEANGITNSSAIVQIRVVGMDSSQNTYTLQALYSAKRQTGDCSLVGTIDIQSSHADVSMLLASASLVANGAALDLNVTGVASTTIKWGGRIDVLYLVD